MPLRTLPPTTIHLQTFASSQTQTTHYTVALHCLHPLRPDKHHSTSGPREPGYTKIMHIVLFCLAYFPWHRIFKVDSWYRISLFKANIPLHACRSSFRHSGCFYLFASVSDTAMNISAGRVLSGQHQWSHVPLIMNVSMTEASVTMVLFFKVIKWLKR